MRDVGELIFQSISDGVFTVDENRIITAFNKAVDTDIVVVNGPSLAGLGGYAGEGTFSHTVSSPTGEGICTPRNFARVRRLALYKAFQMT